MHVVKISSLELELDNAGQILNMGGPWIGDISLKGQLIAQKCIIDNFKFDESRGLLFFIKYHLVNRRKWYFAIQFYNVNSKTVYEFDRVFNMVYLGDFLDKTKLEIYHAFHDQNPLLKSVFDLDQEHFSKLS